MQIAGQEIRRFIGQKYSRFVFGGGTAVVEVPLYKVYAVEIYGHDMVILLDDENIRVRDKLMRVEFCKNKPRKNGAFKICHSD